LALITPFWEIIAEESRAESLEGLKAECGKQKA